MKTKRLQGQWNVSYNAGGLYVPSPVPEKCTSDGFMEAMDNNMFKLKAIDEAAKKEGQLLYRYVTHPFADGQAIYQITKVNKRSVRIKVCTGIGDDWILPAWGEEGTISIDLAKKMVARRDGWNDLVRKSKKETTHPCAT